MAIRGRNKREHIAPIIAGARVAGTGGALFGAFSAGIVYLVIAVLIHFFGVRWMFRLLPPIAVGPVIMVIGLSLASVAVSMGTNQAGGGDYSLGHFLVAFFTLACVLVFAIALKGVFTVVPVRRHRAEAGRLHGDLEHGTSRHHRHPAPRGATRQGNRR